MFSTAADWVGAAAGWFAAKVLPSVVSGTIVGLITTRVLKKHNTSHTDHITQRIRDELKTVTQVRERWDQ